jgi:hypothetical protein
LIRDFGIEEWWIHGKLHRIDGPAIEYPSGRKEWWINDEEFSKEEFEKHPLVIFYRVSCESQSVMHVAGLSKLCSGFSIEMHVISSCQKRLVSCFPTCISV